MVFNFNLKLLNNNSAKTSYFEKYVYVYTFSTYLHNYSKLGFMVGIYIYVCCIFRLAVALYDPDRDNQNS